MDSGSDRPRASRVQCGPGCVDPRNWTEPESLPRGEKRGLFSDGLGRRCPAGLPDRPRYRASVPTSPVLGVRVNEIRTPGDTCRQVDPHLPLLVEAGESPSVLQPERPGHGCECIHVSALLTARRRRKLRRGSVGDTAQRFLLCSIPEIRTAGDKRIRPGRTEASLVCPAGNAWRATPSQWPRPYRGNPRRWTGFSPSGLGIHMSCQPKPHSRTMRSP